MGEINCDMIPDKSKSGERWLHTQHSSVKTNEWKQAESWRRSFWKKKITLACQHTFFWHKKDKWLYSASLPHTRFQVWWVSLSWNLWEYFKMQQTNKKKEIYIGWYIFFPLSQVYLRGESLYTVTYCIVFAYRGMQDTTPHSSWQPVRNIIKKKNCYSTLLHTGALQASNMSPAFKARIFLQTQQSVVWHFRYARLL